MKLQLLKTRAAIMSQTRIDLTEAAQTVEDRHTGASNSKEASK